MKSLKKIEKIKLKSIFIFLISFVLTVFTAFALPVQSFFLPQIAEKFDFTYKQTEETYSLFSKDAVYIMDDWEFYWNELLISGNKKDYSPDLVVSLPSSWTTYQLNGKSLPNGGFATYRKIITRAPNEQNIIITLPNLPGAYRVFVDGKLVSSNCLLEGDIREVSLSNSVTHVNPVVLNYSEDNTYEVIIEVYCENSSGITVLPIIVDNAQYESYTTSLLVFRFFIIGIVAMFLISIVSISVVAFKDNRFFWLILLCITFLIRILISGNGYRLSNVFFFGLSYEVVITIIYATTFVIKLSLFMHIVRSLKFKISDNFMVLISGLFLVCTFIPQFMNEIIFDTANYMLLQAVSYILDVYLLIKISRAVAEKKRFSIPFLIATCILISSMIIDNYFINGYIHKNVEFVFPVAGIIFILLLLIIQIIRIGEAYVAEMKTAALTEELADVNMRLMLSQIKPHFLYNALNTIKYLIKKDPKTAEQVVVKFAKYLRANMDSLTQKTPLPVEKELDHVANYTDIEKHRFGDRLNVVYETDCKNFVILPLTIQPIVENAIKHGINQKPEGGTVTVRTYEDEEHFFVSVADDGVGYDVNVAPSDNDERSHVGINNIKIRLKEMLNATVDVDSKVGEGTKVLITIPKNDETRYEQC
ncbi:MAG: histidine kinase [Clostridia bacterium]|nr:histidine kinase [Clostridia bacterium]